MTHRKSFFGVMIGIHLAFLGLTLLFSASGILSGRVNDGHVAALVVGLLGASQMVLGLGLCIRTIESKSRGEMTNLKDLRN
jgi:NADH:ubiquinone oxidoreductase subunit K